MLSRHDTDLPRPKPARRRLSYTNVTATLALFFALAGGTAWAVTHHYLITSTTQIKPRVLTKLHGAKGSKGTNGTNGANGATGPTGTAGLSGATGATGATGLPGVESVVEETNSIAIGANSSGAISVTCPAGTKLTGGGGADGDVSTAFMYQDTPIPATGGATPTGWEVFYKTGADAITAFVLAVCASW